jgi:hypothetical protein
MDEPMNSNDQMMKTKWQPVKVIFHQKDQVAIKKVMAQRMCLGRQSLRQNSHSSVWIFTHALNREFLTVSKPHLLSSNPRALRFKLNGLPGLRNQIYRPYHLINSKLIRLSILLCATEQLIQRDRNRRECV